MGRAVDTTNRMVRGWLGEYSCICQTNGFVHRPSLSKFDGQSKICRLWFDHGKYLICAFVKPSRLLPRINTDRFVSGTNSARTCPRYSHFQMRPDDNRNEFDFHARQWRNSILHPVIVLECDNKKDLASVYPPPNAILIFPLDDITQTCFEASKSAVTLATGK